MAFIENYQRPFILAVICFLIFNFRAALHKAKLTIQGVAYFLFCNDKSWPQQPDPSSFFTGDSKEINTKVEKKTIIFVRHGESTWNDTFNKGPHRSRAVFAVGFLPGLAKALLYEFYLLLSGKIDSWFYDSPLSTLGLDQVQSLATYLKQDPLKATTDDEERRLLQILRAEPNAPPSILVSSSLRRAVSTVAASFQERLIKNPSEKILIVPSLQEISRNPDTLSITPSQTNLTPSWIDQSYTKCDFKTIFERQVEMKFHHGNKPIDTNGYKRMSEFCRVAFKDIDQKNIIVGGHSIYFRSFFRTFLPNDSDFVGKKKKVVNCGAVAFDLWKTVVDGEERFMIDEKSVKVVYGGFK